MKKIMLRHIFKICVLLGAVILAVIQIFYSVSLNDLQQRRSTEVHTEIFDIIQAGQTKPDNQICIQTPSISQHNSSESFNQSLKILQEETYLSFALVFILCGDSHSEEVSIVTYAQYDWAKTYILPKDTFWGDIYFYTHILENLLVEANYTSEWIGTAPGRSSYKDANDWNVIWMHRMLTDNSLIEDGFDVLVLDDTEDVHRMERDIKWDPIWLDLTDIAFEDMHKSPTNTSSILIDFHTLYNGTFHGMSFVARPLVVHQFTQWINTVIESLSYDSRMMKLSERIPCDKLKITIQEYIYNFLVPYFFISHGNRIMTMSDYKQSGRSEDLRDDYRLASELSHNITEILSSETSGISHLYVLCHSIDTCKHGSEKFSNFSWGRHLYFIPSTYFLETYFYTNVIDSLLESSKTEPDWVGSIAWKAMTKTHVHVIDQMLSDRALVQDGFDVIGFLTPFMYNPRYCNSTMYIQSTVAHGNDQTLIQTIEFILRGIGESDEHISLIRQPYPTFKSFYGSYFVARPVFMREYIKWIRQVMVFTAKDPTARRNLWSDSHYKKSEGDRTVPLKVYGVPYYPLHPFVGERLVQYFFNSRDAKIALLFEYMEKYGIDEGYYHRVRKCPWLPWVG